MALSANGSGNRFRIDFPSISNWTVCMWFRRPSILAPEWQTISAVGPSGGGGVIHILYGSRSVNDHTFYYWTPSNTIERVGHPSDTNWYFCSYGRSNAGGTGNIELCSAKDTEQTVTQQGSTCSINILDAENELWFNSNIVWTSEYGNHVYANIVVYTKVLTLQELIAQRNSYKPIETGSNLWAWWPCQPGSSQRLLDYSGNGRTLTVDGTVTDVSGPPLGFGAPIFYIPPIETSGVDATSSRPGFTVGVATTQSSRAAYTVGGLSANSSRPGFLLGNGSASASQPGFTRGSEDTQSSIQAYTEGVAGTDVSSSLAAFTAGQTQYALRPDGDIVDGVWKDQASGSDLYAAMDEPSWIDTDYVWDEHAQAGDSFEVSLSDPGFTPDTGAHIVRWRAARIANTETVTVKCELVQGTTVIASDQQVLTGSFQTFEYSLSAPEIANITNYNDLRLRFTIVSIT